MKLDAAMQITKSKSPDDEAKAEPTTAEDSCREPISRRQVPRIKTIVPRSDIVEIRVDDEEAKYISKSESELCSTNNNDPSNVSSDCNGKNNTNIKTSPSNAESSSRRSHDSTECTEEIGGDESTTASRSILQKRARTKRGKEQLNQSFCGEFLKCQKCHSSICKTFPAFCSSNGNSSNSSERADRPRASLNYSSKRRRRHANERARVYKRDDFLTITSDSDTNRSTCERKRMATRSNKPRSCQRCKKLILDKEYDDVDDEDSLSSGSATSDQTLCSERSKYTCYCSKNHSHEDLSFGSKRTDRTTVQESELERFRGGNDEWRPPKSTIGDEASSSLVAADFIDNFKHLKIEKLRDGLERLKIRNRDLQGFLRNLQQPLDSLDDNGDDEDASTICTRVSSVVSNVTALTTRRTRSSLLSSVKALETDCRNKDAIIAALADELKRDPKECRARGFQTVERGKGRETVTFTKMDSAVGFFVIALILVSHVQRSELLLYLRHSRKILESSLDGSARLSVVLWRSMREKSTELYRGYSSKAALLSNEILSTSERLLAASRVARLWRFLEPKTDLIFCMYSLASIALVAVAIGRKRGFLGNNNSNNKTGSLPRCKLLLTLYQFFCALLRIIEERIYSSKLFWLLVGFCAHAFLINLLYIKDDVGGLAHDFGAHYCQRDHGHKVVASKDRAPSIVAHESYCSSLWSLTRFYLAKFNDELRPIVNYVSRRVERYF